jgi:hypothetical protein
MQDVRPLLLGIVLIAIVAFGLTWEMPHPVSTR